MNKIHEVELTRAGLLDFGDFFEIQYDSDGEGEVYPDVYSEFEKELVMKRRNTCHINLIYFYLLLYLQ